MDDLRGTVLDVGGEWDTTCVPGSGDGVPPSDAPPPAGGAGEVVEVRTMSVGELAACLGPVWPDVRIVVRGVPGKALGLVGVALCRCDETDGKREVMLVLDVA